MKRVPKFLKYCEGGCGNTVKPGRRFCHGHNRKGKPFSEGHAKNHKIAILLSWENRPDRRELSRQLLKRNHKCRVKGEFHHSEVTRKLIAEKSKGRPAWNKGLTKETDERVNKHCENNKNKKRSQITKDKLKEKWKDPEIRKIRLAGSKKSQWKKGQRPWNYKLATPVKTREKQRLAVCKRIVKNNISRKGFYNTEPEKMMKGILENLKIDFKLQYIVNDILHKLAVDFYIPDLNLIIEVDGKYYHKYPDGREIDHIRNKELIDAGYKILRFWEGEFNLETVKNSLENLTKEV